MKKYFCIISILVIAFSLSSCTDSAPKIEGMIYIPSGTFIMGTDDVDTEGLGREFGVRTNQFFSADRPERKVNLKGFYVDKFEVTNSQYKVFVDTVGYSSPSNWSGNNYPESKSEHPVNNVTWFDSHNYCKWAGKRLLTEAEWEKAARGPKGNIYPWGDEFNEDNANFQSGDTSRVGSNETDRSHYGVYDMAGNVMEWVEDWFKPYPGNDADIKDYGEKHRVLRGSAGSVLGHYIMATIMARGSKRSYYIPTGAGDDAGIRCGRSVEDKGASK